MAQPLAADAIDLLLGDDNDLVMTTDLAFARGIEAVAQLCRIAMQMFAGEWFLDLDIGVPYWDEILGVSPGVAILAANIGFRQELLAVEGVIEILRLDFSFDGASRELTVTWQVRTGLGDTPVDVLVVSGVA